jgi:hypothetical protein
VARCSESWVSVSRMEDGEVGSKYAWKVEVGLTRWAMPEGARSTGGARVLKDGEEMDVS